MTNLFQIEKVIKTETQVICIGNYLANREEFGVEDVVAIDKFTGIQFKVKAVDRTISNTKVVALEKSAGFESLKEGVFLFKVI